MPIDNAILEAKNLSRTIEDSGTLSSPLVPWNTCARNHDERAYGQSPGLSPLRILQPANALDSRALGLPEYWASEIER